MSGDVGAEVAAVLAEHEGYDFWSTTREFICTCETSIGRSYPDRAHREHLADALASLIAERVEAAKAKAVVEFVAWVATNRAYNGSNHPHGQSLYNECINAELPKWARDWIEATP